MKKNYKITLQFFQYEVRNSSYRNRILDIFFFHFSTDFQEYYTNSIL